MISTVTTTTTATVASFSSIGVGSSLALAVIGAMLVCLIMKEVVSVSQGSKPRALSLAINVPMVALAMGFAMIFTVRVAELFTR